MRAAQKRQDRNAAKKSTMSEEEQVWASADTWLVAGFPALLGMTLTTLSIAVQVALQKKLFAEARASTTEPAPPEA